MVLELALFLDSLVLSKIDSNSTQKNQSQRSLGRLAVALLVEAVKNGMKSAIKTETN